MVNIIGVNMAIRAAAAELVSTTAIKQEQPFLLRDFLGGNYVFP